MLRLNGVSDDDFRNLCVNTFYANENEYNIKAGFVTYKNLNCMWKWKICVHGFSCESILGPSTYAFVDIHILNDWMNEIRNNSNNNEKEKD